MFSQGHRYTIQVTLCNFLGGCSVGTHQVTVLKNIKPVAIIPGRVLRTAQRPRGLKLQCQGYVVTCDTTSASSNPSQSTDNLV